MGVISKGQSKSRNGNFATGEPEMMGDLPDSLRTLFGLARAVRSGSPDPDLTGLFGDGIDWVEIIGLADRCRLLPLLISGLRIQDPSILDGAELSPLDDFMSAHVKRCETLIDAHVQLLTHLAKIGVQAVTYKGPALAETVYGNFQARSFRDVDIIVRRDEYETTINEIRNRGFKTDLIDMRTECHLISRAGEAPLVIDLHNSLIDDCLPISHDINQLWDSLRTVNLGGRHLLTFSPEGHLFVCCLHLIKEWHNRAPFFQYALDLAVLLDDRSPSEWCSLLDRANALGVGAYAKLSFSVAARLLGRASPLTWLAGKDDALKALCDDLLADLPRIVYEENPPKSRFYSAKSRRVRRALAPTYRSWLSGELRLAKDQIFRVDPKDQEWLPLPAAIHGLYVVVRPFRLSFQFVKRCRSTER